MSSAADELSSTYDSAIDRICDRFADALCGKEPPKIEDFLAECPDRRERLLRELVALEVDVARRRGEPVHFAGYYDRFPNDHKHLDRVRELLRLDEPMTLPSQPGSETVSMALPEPQKLKHFSLVSIIGQGGFGTVWRAVDTKLQREVAIKIPRRDKFADREISTFLREARAAAKLRHPNIVSVYEVGDDVSDSSAFIVTDYVDGPSLKRWLDTHEVTPRQAAELIIKLARALDHAHSRGVVHRDLKPANVLIDSHGEPHLADFGLAKRETGDDSLAMEGRLVGTPLYMSPEQARGDHGGIDRRSDIYSLGVILYELLTGKLPFRGELAWLLEQIVHVDPKPPRKLKPQIPDDLEKICLKCLSKEPAKRYGNAGDLADDLQRYLNGESLRGVPVPLPRRMRKWVWRNRLLVTALSTTAALCAGIVGGLWWWNTPVTPTRLVEFETEPAGCEITVVKLDPQTGDPDPDKIEHARGKTPLKMRLEPGDYLVVAVLDDLRFHEVMRHVPAVGEGGKLNYPHLYWRVDDDDVIRFNRIHIPRPDVTVDMAFIEGAVDWIKPNEHGTKQKWIVPPFFIDLEEHTAERGIGKELKGSRFLNAVEYAELTGKRLPTSAELLFISRMVSENTKDSEFDEQKLADGKTIRGLFSPPWEWTSTKAPSLQGSVAEAGSAARRAGRLLLCGDQARMPSGLDRTEFPFRFAREEEVNAQFGVRCVRSVSPRMSAADFYRPAGRTPAQ